MSRVVEKNRPCPCGKSSDAYQIYDDGHGYCYSGQCGGRWFAPPDNKEEFEELPEYNNRKTPEQLSKELASYPFRGWRERGLTKNVYEFYNTRAEVAEDGSVSKFYSPSYGPDGQLQGYRVRKPYADKKEAFYTEGQVNGFLGMEQFPGKGKRLVITEGVEDMMAMQQANLLHYGSTYPVVSLASASNARKAALQHRDWLRGYEQVVLWTDNDEPGQKAAEELAAVIGYDRVKLVKTVCKDASEFFLSHSPKETIYAMMDAVGISPAGIVQGEATWEAFKESKDREFVPWPPFMSRLNELTYGRAIGTITLLGAGTGVGKTGVLREDMLHLIDTTDSKIGACFLEDSVGETTASMIGLRLNKRIGLPNVESTEEEERAAWESTLGTGRVMLLDHQGSVQDDSLIDKIEYMALSECKFIYIDHVTIAISESRENDTNKAIDKFMSDLLKLVKRYPIWIGLVSHLRKTQSGDEAFENGGQITEDDFKGSGSLKQIGFQTIALSRNKYAEDPAVRAKTQIWLLKDRKTGASGPAGVFVYDSKTGRYKEDSPGLTKLGDGTEVDSDELGV